MQPSSPMLDIEELRRLVRRMEQIELEWFEFRGQINAAIVGLRAFSNSDYQKLHDQLARLETTVTLWRESEAQARQRGQQRNATRDWCVIGVVALLVLVEVALLGARYL